eukprot:c13995_g1_i2 orf=214-378(+)
MENSTNSLKKNIGNILRGRNPTAKLPEGFVLQNFHISEDLKYPFPTGNRKSISN